VVDLSALPPVPNWLNWLGAFATLTTPAWPWAFRRLRDRWATMSKGRALRRVREMARMYAYLEHVRANPVAATGYAARLLLMDLLVFVMAAMLYAIDSHAMALFTFGAGAYGTGRDIDRLGDLMDGAGHKRRVMKRGTELLAKTAGFTEEPAAWMAALILARMSDCPLKQE
jgi:hypothetical protein